jgi:hypothetical protein
MRDKSGESSLKTEEKETEIETELTDLKTEEDDKPKVHIQDD